MVVDLNWTDPPGSGAALDRRGFEDRYAELAFGLGTVPRRFHDDESLLRRPGVVLFVAIAIVGAFALGRTDDGPQRASTGAATLPVLTARTHARLLLEHVDRFAVLDVDRARLREIPPNAIAEERASRPSPAPVALDAVPIGGDRYTLVAHPPGGGPLRVTADGLLLATGPHLVVWRPYLCSRTCAMRVTDTRTAAARTIARFDPRGGTRVVLSPDESSVVVFEDEPDGARARIVGLGRDSRSRSFRPGLHASDILWSRDSRWAFATDGLDLVALGRDGTLGRVDVILPPFESLTAR